MESVCPVSESHLPVVNLRTPLQELDWLPPQRLRLLERVGLFTVEDLLTHFPKRYEDRRQFDRFPQDESDQPVCLCGAVIRTAVKRLPGWKKMFEAVIEEDGALGNTVTCRWFNVHFVEKMIATGHRLVVFGKPKLRARKICFDHPEFEVVENDEDISIHLKRITPVHRATEGLSVRVIRSTIFHVLERLDLSAVENRVPAGLDDFSTATALRQIHFPDDNEQLARARRHLILAEFFAMQMLVAARRMETAARPGVSRASDGVLLDNFIRALPFPLTKAQRRVIEELRMDLAAARPMNRLLHGDVGSGKTVVALAAMLLAVESGAQAALMAPTQILAEQHYLNFKRWLSPLGISLALRTGARKEDTVPLPLFAMGGSGVPPDLAGILPARIGAKCDHAPTPQTHPTSTLGARYSRRRLPHFEKPWAIYAVDWRTVENRTLPPAARDIVLSAVLHFKGTRYELFAACVMPDHVHLLIQPGIKEMDASGQPVFFTLSEILHSIKSYTAKQVNKLDKVSGNLWQEERYDRYMRSDRELGEKFEYITRNPWDAELIGSDEDYPWSWWPEREGGEEPSGLAASVIRTAGQDARQDGRDARATGSAAQIIIGTHALLYEDGAWPNLGLIVIDEQHKFGVLQRARLIEQASAPDVLVMTATPIPRTLTMTIYGDLDVSTVDELPADRGKIVTGLRDPSKLPEAVEFIRKQIEAGRQAYVVYPLIDESPKTGSKAAAQEFSKWQKLLAPMRCELLHGRIDSVEKDAVMDRFRRGETKVLIATSVIEVGIDVPNATVMVIENAERFGLAQLHQLRGRIGRGEHKSYCILLSDAKNDDSIEKLRTLERTSDGFEIAEADLRLRGSGDILGTAQSGLPPLKLGDLLADAELMRLARRTAREIFERDPQLTDPGHEPYRRLIAETHKLLLSQVS